MNSAVKILIIEDNESQGKALLESVSRKGYEADLARTPAEALDLYKFKDYQIIIVDLLLPKMNGIDLAEQIYKDSAAKPQFIFMSGVFKDKNLIKKAMQRVPALNYFVKPLDLEDLLLTIDEYTKPYMQNMDNELFKLYSADKPSNNEIVEAINKTKTINGYELPWVYSLIINSKLTGVLNALGGDGEIFSCEFFDGNMTFINLKDSETYFGALLIKMGHSNIVNVNSALKNSDQPIGQTLLQNNAIDESMIETIKREQMKIRISKSVKDISYELNFEESDASDDKIYLDRERLNFLLSELISSKVSTQWLKSFFTPWLNSNFLKGYLYDSIKDKSNFPILTRFTKIFKVAQTNATFDKLLKANIKYETELLRALYFLLITHGLRLSEPSLGVKTDSNHQIEKINKIYQNMNNQTYFEIFGISEGATEKELTRRYHELAKVLHPDKFKSSANQELKDVVEKTFSLITLAYTTIKSESKKQAYLNELKLQDTNEYLKNENLMKQAEKFLETRKYLAAYNIYSEIYESKAKPSDFNIYYAWSKIKLGTKGETREAFGQIILNLIQEVPTEDRHIADYFHVKGLYYFTIKDYVKAQKCFFQTLNLNPKHIPAKRELSKLKTHSSSHVSSKNRLFDNDVMDALGAILKKNKKKVS